MSEHAIASRVFARLSESLGDVCSRSDVSCLVWGYGTRTRLEKKTLRRVFCVRLHMVCFSFWEQSGRSSVPSPVWITELGDLTGTYAFIRPWHPSVQHVHTHRGPAFTRRRSLKADERNPGLLITHRAEGLTRHIISYIRTIKLQGKHDLRCTPRFKFNDHVRL